jgi:hypothetical protein
MSPQLIYKNIYDVTHVDSMKRRLLISLVGILMLISLAQAGIIDAAAVSSQQKSQVHAESINEKRTSSSPLVIGGAVTAATAGNDSPIYRGGTVPTALVVNANITAVHVGDTVTASGTLINKNTGEGIPGATIMLQVSFDGNSWTTVARVRTHNNGCISYTGTIPDPRSLGYQVPLTVYGRAIYAGDEMYAGTANTYAVTILPASP